MYQDEVADKPVNNCRQNCELSGRFREATDTNITGNSRQVSEHRVCSLQEF